MTTKKLTFILNFESTEKIFSKYVLDPKLVSNLENGIKIDGFLVIDQNPGPVLSPDRQYNF